MCGIAGIVWKDRDRPTPLGLIESMTRRLAHRGPDGKGFHHAPGVALGHRRLSIIDVEGGKQPLANEDGTVWVVFNGEIYGYQETQRELERRGHRFGTRCDTEVLVHLYEERGPAMVAELRGMFAFAIWDSRRRLLLLARDRLGKKPLVYRHDADGLRFASELKALVAEPGFPKDLDAAALDDYLTYQYVPHPRTIFAAAKKLPPGHYAVYQDGKLELTRYWQPEYREVQPLAEADAIHALRETLTEAVRLRMIADVPLGAFLSGGIDSTIVVGLMRQLAQGPVKTFSIGFPVAAFDESAHARLAAEHLGAEHHEFHVAPDAIDIVHRLSWFYDEPFADSSAVPTYYVSKLTREHVTVALSGDGGDELFAGYPRYQAVRIGEHFDRLPGPVRRLVAHPVWQRVPAPARQKSKLRRAKKLLKVLADSPSQRYRHWVSIFDDASRWQLYAPEFAATLGTHRPADWLDALYAEIPGRDFVTRTTYVDLLSYLPGDILTKVDIASMANNLECRCPFLDREVVALAGRLPIGLKLRGRISKYLLKAAFPDFLPPSLRHRPKMGFGVPIDAWLRNELAPLARDLLTASRFAGRGWLNPEPIRKLLDEHQAATWDHSYRLWSLMMLELWARRYLDDAGSDIPP